MILFAGYVVVTGILVTSETVIGAQKEMSSIQSEILGTGITITGSTVAYPNPEWNLTLSVENIGNQVISEMDEIDLFVYFDTDSDMIRYSSDNYIVSRPLNTDIINPGFWDPGESLTIKLENLGALPTWAQVTTPNGISASTYPE